MSLDMLTTTEQKLLANAWQCMDGQPNIDYVKLAEIMGHTNKRTTQNMMGMIRKKLAAAEGNIIPLAISAPATPTKGNSGSKAVSKKRKTAMTDDGDDLGGAEECGESPAGKKGKGVNGTSPKKPRPSKKNIKTEEQVEDEPHDEPEDEAEAGEGLLEIDAA